MDTLILIYCLSFSVYLIGLRIAILQYQHPSPEKHLGDTLNALSSHAEHPPLYYLLARGWAALSGSSVADMRALPAIISLFALPAIYWLCWELFQSPLVGGIAMMLVMVSPFHFLYAQEAREYSLWTTIILLSSAALLRAIRVNNKVSWAIYGVTVALNFYTHLLAVLVSISHGIYVLAEQYTNKTKIIVNYLISSLGGILAFSPWLVIVVINLMEIHETIKGSREPLSFSTLVDKWFLNFNRIFLDVELGGYNFIWVLISLYALYFLTRKVPKKVGSFVLILIGVTALTLIIPDVVFEGRRSTIMRYLAPCCIGIEIAVAYWLAHLLTAEKARSRTLGKRLTAFIMSAGIIGGSISSQADVWWTKSVSRSGAYKPVAEILEQSDRPLLISHAGQAIGTLAISHELDPDIHLQLLPKNQLPEIPNSFPNVFVLDSFDEIVQPLQAEKNYQFESVHRHRDEAYLWKLQN
ncbi:MAG: dolichyl-phosphate-mannose-protein mannosyltransferase [Cyanobacteria bacterium SW_9_44_58]|nr:MAG: dolichyl-phosphate-mannose-protein mannosyltransferase [Cyanobacteria bacterium SW_9_44_58]